MDTDKLLTFNEAKEYLRVNKITLYKLIRNNELPAFRVGKQIRIPKKELMDWLQKQRVNNNKTRFLNKTNILELSISSK